MQTAFLFVSSTLKTSLDGRNFFLPQFLKLLQLVLVSKVILIAFFGKVIESFCLNVAEFTICFTLGTLHVQSLRRK